MDVERTGTCQDGNGFFGDDAERHGHVMSRSRHGNGNKMKDQLYELISIQTHCSYHPVPGLISVTDSY